MQNAALFSLRIRLLFAERVTYLLHLICLRKEPLKRNWNFATGFESVFKSLTCTYNSIPIEMGSFPAEKDIHIIHGGIGRHLVVKRLRLPSVPAPTYTWKKVRNVDDESPMPLNRNRRIVQDREGKISHQVFKDTLAD